MMYKNNNGIQTVQCQYKANVTVIHIQLLVQVIKFYKTVNIYNMTIHG